MANGSQEALSSTADRPLQNESSLVRALKIKEADSRPILSSTEGPSMDEDMDAASSRKRRKKKRNSACYRHAQHQIQEMERLFKHCPHPDENTRLRLSRELNLSPRQVKFWFQNKRTQIKMQQDRLDNSFLRSEIDRLKAENAVLQETIRNLVCLNCGMPVKTTSEVEMTGLDSNNAEVKEDAAATGLQSTVSPRLVSWLDNMPKAVCDSSRISVAEIASQPLHLVERENPMVVELAVSAMEELAEVAQAGHPLWLQDVITNKEWLNSEEYVNQFGATAVSPALPGLDIEASRGTSLVIMDASTLVETLMDVDLWAQMFSAMISKALTVEVLSNGDSDGSFDGRMQLMYAELHLPSPLVPTREVYFLRYSKRVDHSWVVVDVSVDALRADPPPSLLKCRKRPSGCIIEETRSGSSKVTWVEHMEADNTGIEPSFQSFVKSGMGFGSQRWLTILQRQCEHIGSLLFSNNSPSPGLLYPKGQHNILKLAERMTSNLFAGVGASAKHNWVMLAGTHGEECKVVIRQSNEDPGRSPGLVLSAATSLHLPQPPASVYDFFCDKKRRVDWDILSDACVMKETLNISKGQDCRNTVSLLQAEGLGHNRKMILQECCSDEVCSFVIYASVDLPAMEGVINGDDPDPIVLLPSGFFILPYMPAVSYQQQHTPQPFPKLEGESEGSLLTVAFQLLVDPSATAKLSLESVATVNNIISSTVMKIKSALS